MTEEDIQIIFKLAMPECSGCSIVYQEEYINDEPDLGGYAFIDSEDLETYKKEPFVIYYAQPCNTIEGSWENSAIDLKTLLEILADEMTECILKNKKIRNYRL